MVTKTRDMEEVGVVDPDYPVTPVPMSARKSFFSLMVVLLGFTIFTPTLLAGAALGPTHTFSGLMYVIFLGSLILGAYVATLGYVGAKTGLTTVVMARQCFGNRGSKLASILLGGTQVGWYGVVVGTIGDLTAQAFGWESFGAAAIVMIITSFLMCLTACYGYRGMYFVSLISTPLIIILLLWVAYRSLGEVGGFAGLLAIEPTSTMSTSAAITIVVGTFVSAGSQAPNWTRFGRTGGQAFWACVIGFLIGNGAMIIFGAIGAITFGEGDFVLVLYDLGMVFWGLLLLFGNLWKSNADAAYAFGVAGSEMFNHTTKTPFIVGGVFIGTLLALLGIQNFLVGYLNLLGTFIPPLGGIIIADYWCRMRHGLVADKMLPAFHGTHLAIYFISGFIAWLTEHYSIGVAPLNGVILAILLTVLAFKFNRQPLA